MEWLLQIGMLAGLGVLGGFVIAPYRSTLPFAYLAAPFSGMLVLAFGVSVTYNVLGLPLAAGFVATCALCGLATAWSAWRERPSKCWRSALVPLALAVAVAAASTVITMSTSIRFGHPGLQFMLGTDHINYAHLADWMIAHPPSDPPQADASVPYESMPALLFEMDPRSGAWLSLALVAMVRGLPSTFAFDPLSGLVLSATVLGVAGVFARGRLTLVILVVGLFTAHWYDYPRTGYLAKSLAYPGAFMLVGLLMATCTPLQPGMLGRLLLVASGVMVDYWAEAPGLFIGLIGGTYIIARVLLGGRAALRRPLEGLRPVLPHAVALMLIGIAGIVMRRYVAVTSSPTNRLDWVTNHTAALLNPSSNPQFAVTPRDHVILTLADLEHQALPLTGLSSTVLTTMLVFSVVCWIALAGLAWLRRDPQAIALTNGPLALAAFLLPLTSPTAQWTTYQLPGSFYPLALCAAARLVDGTLTTSVGGAFLAQLKRNVLPFLLVLLMVVSIGLRLPRFIGTAERFTSDTTLPWLLISSVEVDRLAEAIGDRLVRVDIAQPHLSFLVMVELGRRDVNIQWGPGSWQYVLRHRGWPVPDAQRPPDLILQGVIDPEVSGAETIMITRQYRLLRPLR